MSCNRKYHDPCRGWRFAVDRGGTFTDIIGIDPYGGLHQLKLLSKSDDCKDPSISGIKRIIGVHDDVPLSGLGIESVRFGTTVATNALLERKGGRIALLITEGFSDLLRIGYQNRPDIFKLCVDKVIPVYKGLFEVKERVDVNGRIVTPLDAYGLEKKSEEIAAASFDAVAVLFLHSWRNPVHELLCEEILVSHGVANVYLSHRSSNLVKAVTRGGSTLLDTYLAPVLETYIDEIIEEARGIHIGFIRSSGDISEPGMFRGKDAVLSGPAGGVIAVAETGRRLGFDGVIGFDMGGTSTDVCRYDGEFERIDELTIEGMEMQTDMLSINTVAAGGGSILRFDGERMVVGPGSAGAYPGPACYGFGGPLTITDANLVTGRIIPEYFPHLFGHDHTSSLDELVVSKRFRTLTAEINNRSKTDFTPHDVAIGFIRIANEKMAGAIRQISVSRGFDVREYGLVAFGGAGGQHACEIAELLGIRKVIFPLFGGLMSAYGIGLARDERRLERSLMGVFEPKCEQRIADIFKEMKTGLLNEGEDYHTDYVTEKWVVMRQAGTGSRIRVDYSQYDRMLADFRKKFNRLYGFHPIDGRIELLRLGVCIRHALSFFPRYPDCSTHRGGLAEPVFLRNMHTGNGYGKVPVYEMSSLSEGWKTGGPALIAGKYSTLLVGASFKVVFDNRGYLVLEKGDGDGAMQVKRGVYKDPVLLEVFNNLFSGIASGMGHLLKGTAHSVNIKEREDFSCSVFDSDGNLVANAPHIPVHLGSMSETVKSIINKYGKKIAKGDVYLTNNPFRGGSHLPDITVVTPIFSSHGGLIFFAASRGHHADIGGVSPGSMPATASSLGEEGIMLDRVLIVKEGRFMEDMLTELLLSHPYPARNIPERIGDIKAQIAACHRGETELNSVVKRYGLKLVNKYMYFIRENAAYSIKKALSVFISDVGNFKRSFEDRLDDGTILRVCITITGGNNPPDTLTAVIDFTGTGEEHKDDNLNAPVSVTLSAVIYLLRSLACYDIPLNSGCMDPVEIIIPEGTILNPSHNLPVASGNVETSQRVVDLLLGALGVSAASQGTMNNLLFQVSGDVPYYETIAGGGGASSGCPGASGIQVHMTNTRITDPEIIELMHPHVRVEEFRLRYGSGGDGIYGGGDGVIRKIRFLKEASVSIISERRVYSPYGMAGGGPGKKGKNILERSNGETVTLPGRLTFGVEKGDAIIIKTPGGGGFGRI